MENIEIIQEYPEYQCPAIVAYYHIPSIWCVESPTDDEWQNSTEEDLIKDVLTVEINGFFKYRVRRDGLFVFDFSIHKDLNETIIPKHEIKSDNKIPQKVTNQENIAEEKAYKRAAIIKAFQSCLCVADVKVGKVFRSSPRLVNPSELISLYFFNQNSNSNYTKLTNNPYRDHLLIYSSLGLSNRNKFSEIKGRYTLKRETIEYAFSLIESVLTNPFEELSNLVEMLYRAVASFANNNYSDTLVLCWTICERLVNYKWETYLNNSIDPNFPKAKQRKKNLVEGVDYKSSIKIEVLNLSKQIPDKIYEDLNKVRRARNKNLHSLVDATSNMAVHAVRTTEKLISFCTGVDLSHPLSRDVPGTGSAPTKLIEEYSKRYQK